ncbi:MAG: hypothetical protein M0Z54_04930 [Thermaerobacter sp.]|nr:hypothetical protein [Thermaerobacter sp.]
MGRTQATYLGAQCRRMVRPQGKKRAAVLGAHTLAVDIGYLLTRHTPYVDLGGTPGTGGTPTRCGATP